LATYISVSFVIKIMYPCTLYILDICQRMLVPHALGPHGYVLFNTISVSVIRLIYAMFLCVVAWLGWRKWYATVDNTILVCVYVKLSSFLTLSTFLAQNVCRFPVDPVPCTLLPIV
jgi:hypothetical protein